VTSLKIGDRGILEKNISEKDIVTCAEMTGDYNPIHLDDEAAKELGFSCKIAHGVFSIGLISAVLGTKMPGPGTILIEQKFDYKRPVLVGDTVKAVCEVVDIINGSKGIYKINTNCFNQNEQLLLEGYAIVKYKG
jgi:3-hydroxybutyryl-CoA dehydratase